MGKAAKGTVVVQAPKGRLRLVWSYGGDRYFLSMGLVDSKVNRIVAEGKARLIEGDMATGNFDPALNKYKPQEARSDSIALVELFAKYKDYKSRRVTPNTLAKYDSLINHLQENFQRARAIAIKESDAEDFKQWCLQRMEAITFKNYLVLLSACWDWGIKQKWLTSNPWAEIKVKVPPKQKPKPFTTEEIEKIIEGFRSDRVYSYYTDYVEFVLSAGCRLGEGAALKWKHLSADLTTAWVGESICRGNHSSPKGNRDRTITLNPRLTAMLLARKPDIFNEDALVFPTPRGCPIDDGNFRNRAWKPILKRVGVTYRKPKTMRSTAVSHLLGYLPPTLVAEIAGHSVEVLYTHYAGNVSGKVVLPDYWDRDA